MGIEIKPKECPEFRASYVYLQTPKPVNKKDGAKKKYSVMALFAPGQDISALKTAARKAVEEKFGADKALGIIKHPKFKSPFKDQAELVDDDGEQRPGTVAGAIFVNLSHEIQPVVLGLDARPMKDMREFYSGCYAVAQLEAYAWEHDEGGKGVSFGLVAIQKRRDGDRLGGGGLRADPDAFEPIKGSATDASDVFGEDGGKGGKKADLDDDLPF